MTHLHGLCNAVEYVRHSISYFSPVKIFCDHNVITNHGRDHGRDTPFTVITPSAMRDWNDHTRDQGVITPLTVILYSDGVITYG